MAVTINSSSTPPLITFKGDLLEICEQLDRGGFLAQQLSPGTRDLLRSLGSDSANTTLALT